MGSCRSVCVGVVGSMDRGCRDCVEGVVSGCRGFVESVERVCRECVESV